MWKEFGRRRSEQQVRLWIRQRMARHQLKRVFEIINEEYRRVYHEDNFPSRQDFLHELVDTTDPDSYIWGRLAGTLGQK